MATVSNAETGRRSRGESGTYMPAGKEPVGDGQIAPPNPPDRGYAWFVVIGSFLCNGLVDGMCFSYGVMREHIATSFVDASPSLLSVAGSCLTGAYLVTGPLSSALANTFGCRIVVMVGSLLACAAFFTASYITNIYLFIAVFGVLGGVSFGLIYLPAVVTVGFWFERRRAFATGVAVCGSGIGTAVFSLLIDLLINRYSWRGALMILSAVVLNCAIAGSFFMPLERYYEILTLREKRRRAKGRPMVKGHIIQKLIENKKRERNISQGSLNGWIITNNNKVEPPPPDYDDRPMLSTEAITRIAENVLKRKSTAARKLTSRNSFVAEGQSRSGLPQLVRDYAQSQNSLANTGTGAPLQPHTAVNSAQHSPLQSTTASHNSLHALNEADVANEEVREAITKSVLREMLRPMNRKDVFHSGSLHQIAEYTRSKVSIAGTRDYYKSVTSIPNDAGKTTEPVKSACSQMLDITILRSPTFILLLFTSLMTMMGFLQFYQFIKAYAVSRGIGDAKATTLVSVIGIANTVGRVVSGWMSDRPWADSLWINNIALIGSGIATAAIPFCIDFNSMVVCASVYGLFISAWVSLRTVLLIELLGLDKLTNAYGILLLFQGIGIIVGPPLGSAIDQLGIGDNYSMSFFMAGLLLSLSGVLSCPLRKLSKWEDTFWPEAAAANAAAANAAAAGSFVASSGFISVAAIGGSVAAAGGGGGGGGGVRSSVVVSVTPAGDDNVDGGTDAAAGDDRQQQPLSFGEAPIYRRNVHEPSPDDLEIESRI